MISERRQRRAKRKTVIMPLNRKLHQNQFAAMPFLATWPVTQRGVSAANVVATIEVPASHQETSRPETKKSFVEALAFLRKYRPIRRLTRKYAPTTIQSPSVIFIGRPANPLAKIPPSAGLTDKARQYIAKARPAEASLLVLAIQGLGDN